MLTFARCTANTRSSASVGTFLDSRAQHTAAPSGLVMLPSEHSGYYVRQSPPPTRELISVVVVVFVCILTHSLTDDHCPGTHAISTEYQLTDDNHAYFVSRLECGNPDAPRCCDGRARLTALLASGLVTLLDGSSPQAPVQSLHELCRRRGVL